MTNEQRYKLELHQRIRRALVMAEAARIKGFREQNMRCLRIAANARRELRRQSAV